jgi:single-strand DNA-binding protein
MSLNLVTLLGAIAKPPIFNQTAKRVAVCNLVLAGSEDIVLLDQSLSSVDWNQNVTLFGQDAELLRGANEGEALFVSGSLEYRSWDAGNSKQLRVRARFVELLERDSSSVVRDQNGFSLKFAKNEVQINGTLSRPPSTGVTPNRAPYCHLTVAINDSWFDRTSQKWNSADHYVDVVFHDALSHHAATLEQGQAIYVVGRLINDPWTGASGEARFKTKVFGSDLEALVKRPQKLADSPTLTLTPQAC